MMMQIVIVYDKYSDLDLLETVLVDVYPGGNIFKTDDAVQLEKMLDSINGPGLVVIDLNIPVNSGKDCLKKIRAQHKWSQIPVIILSASPKKRDFQECMLDGADHYFVKPFIVDQLKHISLKIQCSITPAY